MITVLIIYATIQTITICVLLNINNELKHNKKGLIDKCYNYRNELSKANTKITNLKSHCNTLKSHYKKVIRELKKNISKESGE